jgi:glucose-6-phosphate isomerase
MSEHDFQPITYDPRGVLLPGTGMEPGDLAALAPKLEAARAETLADVDLWQSRGPVPNDKEPLDAGFLTLPERLLADHAENGPRSEIGRILATAVRFNEHVDRAVVLGIGGSYMGAKALFDSCCHSYHNELSRDARRHCPRVYFEGNNVDNDASQGLLDLIGRSPAADRDHRWGILVISKSGGTLETAAAFRIYLNALRTSLGDSSKLGDYVVPVTGPSGKLYDLSQAIGCPEMYYIPDGVGGRFSVLTAVGLLPAAILGLDILKLLTAAADMNRRFRELPVGQNPVLDYVGISHLMEVKRGATIRVLSTWSKGLESAGLWYDQLLSESLGKHEKGATPLTVVNTRDLHSRGQQHQEGRRDKLITNVIVDHARRDALAIGMSELDQDKLNEIGNKTLPDILSAAIRGTNEAYAEDRRPTADLHLPRLDEAALGQFFQMMMLATVVEGRLIGVNPYGQPGVEGYKKHMNKNLRK